MSDLVEQLSDKLRIKKWKLVTAESCTGGMIATAITDKAGSSEVFDRGFVTYSNQAKIDCLGVLEKTLEQHGAVSMETAEEMAQGALENSGANIAVSVTGIAGPDGGSEEKPVGLVYIGTAVENGGVIAKSFHFEGSRGDIRQQTVEQALTELLKLVN